jgi:DNA ligase-1
MIEMKAMLACNKIPKLDDIKFMKLVSYKLDGIRALAIDGVAISRNGLPLPNLYVQSLFKYYNLNGIDGELMLTDPTKDFNDAQSAFMTAYGRPQFKYCVFDSFFDISEQFIERTEKARQVVAASEARFMQYMTHTKVATTDYLSLVYEDAVKLGYEGLILRDPNAPYKLGRSTEKQQWMLKLKPVADAEGIITGFEELMHNEDTSTKKLENMVPGNTLGAFILSFGEHIVKVGTGRGLTAKLRKELWDKRHELLGKPCTFSYQELSKYGVPRFPRFRGIREEFANG